MTLPVNDEQLHALLTSLLAPETVKAATLVMKRFLKQKNSTCAMVRQICAAPQSECRQMATVLLRKQLASAWPRLKPTDQNQVKLALLARILEEPTHIVRHNIAGLVASVARMTRPLEKRWPELLQFLLHQARHPQAEQRALAMVLFSALTETIPQQLRKHFATLQQIFYTGLSDTDTKVRVQSLHALSSLTNLAAGDPTLLQTFQQSVLPLAHLVQQLKEQEEETLIAGLDLLENWTLADVRIVQAHVPALCAMAIGLLVDNEVSLDVRTKAAGFLSMLVTNKAIGAVGAESLPRLVEQLLHTAIALISTDDGGDNKADDDDDDDGENISPDGAYQPDLGDIQQLGIELLDDVLVELPESMTYAFMIKTVAGTLDASLIQTQSASQRRTAYLLLAVMVDGCGKSIAAQADLAPRLICQGIQDRDESVRYAASLAMHDMARHLPALTAQYCQLLLPAAVQALMANAHEAHKIRRQHCENLAAICAQLDKEKLAPFLAPIMHQVVAPLLGGGGGRTLANSTMKLVAQLAESGGDLFMPFAVDAIRAALHLMDLLDAELKGKGTGEEEENEDEDEDEEEDESDEMLKVQRTRAHALRCISTIIDTIDESETVDAAETFLPFISVTMRHLFQIVRCTNSEVREACFSCFGSIIPLLPPEKLEALLSLLIQMLLLVCGLQEMQEHGHQNELLVNETSSSEEEEEDEEEETKKGDDQDEGDDADDAGAIGMRASYRTGVIEEKVAAFKTLAIAIEHATPAVMHALLSLTVQLMQTQMNTTHYAVQQAACQAQLAAFEWIFKHQYECAWREWMPPALSRWIELMATEEDTAFVAIAMESVQTVLKLAPYATIVSTPQLQTALGEALVALLTDKAAMLQFDDEDRADSELVANTYAAMLEPLLELVETLANVSGSRVFGTVFWPALGPLLIRAQQRHSPTNAKLAECFTKCTQGLAAVPLRD